MVYFSGTEISPLLFHFFILLSLTILVAILVPATFVEYGNEGIPTDREARGTSKITAEATASERGRA